MSRYRILDSMDRVEIAKEPITLKQNYKNFAPETHTVLQSVKRETGDDVTVSISLDCHYETDEPFSSEQRFMISNAVKALILLKGEECVDEELITKFIKKNTGIKINNLTIDSATKTYSSTFLGGEKYSSEKIDLKPPVTKGL